MGIREKILSKTNPALWLMLPALIFLVLTMILPFLYALRESIFWSELSAPNLRRFVGLGNYLKIITNRSFLHSLQVTMIFTVAAVSIELLVGFCVALLLNQDINGVKIFRSILIIPMVITPVVVGLCWKIMFEPTYGIINYLLGKIGIPPQSWITSGNQALQSILLVDVWFWTPFFALVLLAGLQSIPTDILEASTIDGASGLQNLMYIIFPHLGPIILIVTLIRVIDCIRIFDYIFVLTKGGPGNVTELLSIYVWRLAFRRFYIGLASTGAILVLILVIFLSQFFFKRLAILEK